MLITPGGLMKMLCRQWVTLHPEDDGFLDSRNLRKLLRVYAIEGGSSMVLQTADDGFLVHHFALIEYNHFHG